MRRLIETALAEDSATQDITTQTLIPKNLQIEAEIRSKDHGVACGLPFAEAIFKGLDKRLQFTAKVREGQSVKPGDTLAAMRGQARAILSGERSALNAVQHLSGIASYTRKQVQQVTSRRTAILDTRKTIPGWRELQKYAVFCGGGKNHRMSLSDSILIKDNHLAICRLLGVPWQSAIRSARRKYPRLLIEMEVQTERDFKDALELVPDQILLDNQPLAQLKSEVKRLRQLLPKAEIEVSGGVRTEQIKALSRLGVERISMGRLTHSAPAFDCSLDITHVYHSR